MREILFRGKRKDNGEWVEGYYLNQRESLTDKKACYIAANNGYGFNYISVIPETVGQYTGLTDKNGRKIFEGDIINYKGALAKVIYSTENAGFYALFSSWDTDLRALSAGKYVSVIGNIYDNPELLEVKQNEM